MIIKPPILAKLFRFYSSQAKITPNKLGMGLPTAEIVKSLQGFASLTLAESWDNVGLLVDAMNEKNVKNILLTNDLTEDVVKEAIHKQAEFIVSYHPNIFQGLKSVSTKTWKERIVIQCIKNNISVYSPHTSWDSVEGGVNDWLAKAFEIHASKAILPKDDSQRIGAGRLLKLQAPITIESAIELIKKHIGIGHLRLALAKCRTMHSSVESVALCAGSGNSVLSGIDADLYLTGEMLHHDVLDATQRGVNVVLCNHSDSERGFLREFKEILQNRILDGACQVIVSEIDKDPLVTV